MRKIKDLKVAWYAELSEIKMPTITITGDTTQEALEQVLYQGIAKYGKDFNVQISPNLRFENQNKEIKDLWNSLRECEKELQDCRTKKLNAYSKLGEMDASDD